MHLIRNIYYWASEGCPEALPAGIIAVNMHSCIDLRDDIKEVSNLLCSIGIFDDSCWQIGCTQDDVDLIVKTVEHPQYGEMGKTLSNDQIIPDWQWAVIRLQPNLKISEHDFEEYLEFLPPEDRPGYESCMH